MKYEVYKIREEKDNDGKSKYTKENLIKHVTTVNWSDDKNSLFLSFDFITEEKLKKGDWIELYNYTNSETVFIGKIENISVDKDSFKYSGYDYGKFLLEENIDIQFNEDSIQNAISQICSKKKINYKTIDANTPNNLKKIYRNTTVDKVLKDIYKISLEQNILSDNYYFNCKKGFLNLLEYKEVPKIQGYTGGRYRINSFEYVISVDGRTWNRKQQIEFQNGSTLKVYADYKLQTGIYTHIRNDVLKMNDYYLVTSSKHYIKGGLEEVEVTLVKYKPINNESSSNESTPSL